MFISRIEPFIDLFRELFRKKVVLQKETVSGTYVRVEAYLDKRNGLVVEGQDIGDAPELFFGDFDYEYWITIPQDQLQLLRESLINELQPKASSKLLRLFELKFKGQAYSDITEWLKRRGIKYEFFSY